LRLVIVGGEKASPAAFQAWRNLTHHHEHNRVRWINTYGPTETTVIATAYEPPTDSIPAMLPIGKPIANVQVHILDSSLRPVPIGVRGELHIGGAGVARGYLNRPEMTEQKFIPDPFRGELGARLYKTGDMARYLPTGDIEFLGRTDDQIKIRGFRVELGEIEAVLSHHPGVHEPVVVVREDGRGEKVLVAYYLAAQQPAPTATVLRSFLKDKLPEYMLPSAFIVLEAMPMTPNGKVDRRALPTPQQTDLTPATGQFVVSKDELELQLVKVWELVLGKSPIGVRQNFFDLGGHSLLAVRLMHRLEQIFGKKMPITTLFMAPTIEQLAELLRRDGWSPSWSSLVPIQPEGTKPPFFCVHGAGGTVIIYRDLAQHLGPDQPVYGLQAQGLDGSQQRLNSVEEMAEHYLRDMRTVQPQGPYFLGGLSFGGTVAFEIARRLRAEGEEVGVLALFDTFAGKHESNRQLLAKLWRLPFSEKVSYVAHKSKQYAKTLTRKLQHGFLPPALIKVREGIQQAGARYTATPYEGSVVLFRASRKSLRGTHDPYAGWRELALGGLEIHEIPGDHVGIVLEPQVRILAKHLRHCLEQSQAQTEMKNAQEQLCTR
jgi:aspartate racemase